MKLDQSYGNRIVSFDHGDDWVSMVERWIEWLNDLDMEDVNERIEGLIELLEFAVDDVQYKEDLFDELDFIFNSIAPEGYVFGLHPKRPYYGFFEEVE